MNYSKFILILSFIACMTGCKEIYNIPVQAGSQSFLVVEGNLNNSAPTTIRLTRTFRSDSPSLKPELFAQLTVEGKDNIVYPLDEQGNGYYGASQLNLVTGQDYRLHIKTNTGKEYLSDFVTFKKNPPIDSISWKRDNNGVTIYANTHDPENSTRYYRWEYEETWEIHSRYFSRLKYVNGGNPPIVERDTSENVFICYKSYNSNNIILGSSARLQSDVIHESPLILIPNATEKLAFRYSVLVRQFTLSKEAYQYYQLMKKNTETVGSIFDAQPSELRGNIHSVGDPNEMVIGYLTAGPVHEQRIFISASEIPDWNFSLNCQMLLSPPDAASVRDFASGYELIDAKTMGIIIVGYYFSSHECVDCTSRGGNTRKPIFW